MVSDRTYRKEMPEKEVLEIMESGKNVQLILGLWTFFPSCASKAGLKKPIGAVRPQSSKGMARGKGQIATMNSVWLLSIEHNI